VKISGEELGRLVKQTSLTDKELDDVIEGYEFIIQFFDVHRHYYFIESLRSSLARFKLIKENRKPRGGEKSCY
jgi:hypothetical protein